MRPWHSLRCNLPTQAVCDMRIHPREKDLIIGTHGRGVFVMPVEKIQKLTPDVLKKEAHLYPIPETRIVPPRFGAPGGARIDFWTSVAGPATIMVKDTGGALVKNLAVQAVKGMNIVEWNLIPDGSKASVKPGEYTVELRVGKTVERGALKVTAFQFTR